MYYLLLVPLYFLLRKTKKRMNPNAYNIEKNLRDIYQIFGEGITKSVEEIYRLETANFTSGQFTKTFSAGMEVGRDKKGEPILKFPFGWNSLEKFWKEQSTNKPLGVIAMKESKGLKGKSGGKKYFIEFPNLFSAMFSLALTIQKRGGDAGKWYSTDPEQIKYYNKILSSQRTTLTDKIKSGVTNAPA